MTMVITSPSKYIEAPLSKAPHFKMYHFKWEIQTYVKLDSFLQVYHMKGRSFYVHRVSKVCLQSRYYD